MVATLSTVVIILTLVALTAACMVMGFMVVVLITLIMPTVAGTGTIPIRPVKCSMVPVGIGARYQQAILVPMAAVPGPVATWAV
jgi:hypothetical protein